MLKVGWKGVNLFKNLFNVVINMSGVPKEGQRKGLTELSLLLFLQVILIN